jgi:hypothetical protein
MGWGILSVVALLPAYGIIPLKDHAHEPPIMKLPWPSLIYIIGLSIIHNIVMTIVTRGANLRILWRENTLLKKFGVLNIMLWGYFIDFGQLMKEFIPFYHNDEHIKINWIDN